MVWYSMRSACRITDGIATPRPQPQKYSKLVSLIEVS